jgi:hypothetical protein
MKIVPIFAENLFSFHYQNEKENEFDRLMELWTDVGYLHDYATHNAITDIQSFINDIIHDAEQIQDFLENIDQIDERLEIYFQPLKLSGNSLTLVFQKGKMHRNRLRLYAIKVDENCFVITGGAIKMSQTMQEHPDTAQELVKLNRARTYLEQEGVQNEDAFLDFLNDEQ